MNPPSPFRARPLATALVFAVAVSLPAAAQEPDEPDLGWAATAELSLAAAAGNTETSSLGLRATATRTWAEMLLKVEGGALRVEQTERTRRAVGPPGGVVVVEEEDSVLTADNQFLRGRLDREIGERLLAFAGAGWERDELAGIADRLSVAGGLGHVWADREDFVSRTTYGVTYTWEESTAGREDDFAGLRAGWDLLRRLTPTTVFTNALVVDQNLEETSDLRVEELASVAVTISDRLALKVSAHLKLDADPALLEVPREEPEGTPTGDVVLVELDELDTVLSAALVVSF
jgi:putative salt-induced outer membrane protein YdiY